jgi:O-antigen/teichoic acid export membrane protein
MAQRAAQLLAILCIAHRLGVTGAGVYGEGMAIGGILCVLAGAGTRNHVARAIAQQPELAGDWLAAAVKVRLVLGTALAAGGAAVAFARTEAPWFWTLCVLQAIPAAFDLKGLADAAARTRREVALETTAGLLQVALVSAWALSGGRSLETLAAIQLASRAAYALGAALAIARVPAKGTRPSLVQVLRGCRGVAVAQTMHELLIVADVALVAWCGGSAAAGRYAVAARIATMASLPSLQIARLLLPHLHRAARHGDPQRTLRAALRAIALATLPMAAGGLAVAAPLCGLFGGAFTAAAPTLQLALFAMVLQHLGWQFGLAAYAAGRDRAFAVSLGVPALLQVAMLLALVPAAADVGGAVALLAAQAAYFAFGFRIAGARDVLCSARAWLRPAALAALATGSAAAAAGLLPFGPWTLAAQLAAGALAWLLCLHFVELGGRWRSIGDGLAAASTFRS